MGGEYYVLPTLVTLTLGSPPHARGILDNKPNSYLRMGITPACAGNTHKGDKEKWKSRDHPRMRGEYMCGAINELTFVGSPPHARGIRHSCSTRSLWTGITPACAGNTELEALRDLDARDHPRMRGEYLDSNAKT